MTGWQAMGASSVALAALLLLSGYTFRPDMSAPEPGYVPSAMLATSLMQAEVAGLLGDWRNVDRETGGITRIIVRLLDRDSDTLQFRTFGACVPTDCDWGVAVVPYESSPVVVLYDFSFKTTTLTLWRNGSELSVDAVDRYTDASGRRDRHEIYTFKLA